MSTDSTYAATKAQLQEMLYAGFIEVDTFHTMLAESRAERNLARAAENYANTLQLEELHAAGGISGNEGNRLFYVLAENNKNNKSK